MAPSKDYIVSSTQALVVIRPTAIAAHAHHPLMQPPNMAQLLHAEISTSRKWVGKQGKPLYFNDQLTPIAVPAAADNGVPAAGATVEGYPPALDWSKSGVSQVDALRQQVEASNLYADGQLDSGLSMQDAPATEYAVPVSQNNIVAAPISNRVDANSLIAHHNRSANRLVSAGPAAGLDLSAESPAANWEVASIIDSRSSVRFSNSHISSKRPSTKVRSAIDKVRAVTSSKISRDTSRSSTPVALRTEDWPVLSGRPHNPYKDAKKSWHLPGLSNQSRQLLEYQQKYGLPGRPNTAAAAAAAASAAGGLMARYWPDGQLGAPLAQQAAVAASQLLVPVEYLQVSQHTAGLVCCTASSQQVEVQTLMLSQQWRLYAGHRAVWKRQCPTQASAASCPTMVSAL